MSELTLDTAIKHCLDIADGSKPLPDDAVTHWMPLPEPPKEDDAE